MSTSLSVSLHTSLVKFNLYDYYMQVSNIPNLSKEDELDCIKRAQEKNDTVAVSKLVNAYLKLSFQYAYAFYQKYVIYPLDDLVSEANIGILMAIKNFNVESGFRLATFVTFYFKERLFYYVKKMGNLIENKKCSTRSIDDKTEKPVYISLSNANEEEKPIEIEDFSQSVCKIESDIDKYTVRQKLLACLEELPEKYRCVINKRIYTENDKLTNEQLALELGISKQRVSQIEQSALKRLREIWQAKYGDFTKEEFL